MSDDTEIEKAAVLRRLEQQRQRIEALFGKPKVPSTGMVGTMQNGFPRSQTMRLLMSEPTLTAGFSALTGHLLGPRTIQVLRALIGAFRAIINANKSPILATQKKSTVLFTPPMK